MARFWIFGSVDTLCFVGATQFFDKSNTFTYGNEIVLVISAIAVWLVSKKLNGAKGKVLIDPQTNKEVLLKEKHTMFWMPMEWYSVLLGALAIFVLSKHFV